MQLYTLTGQYVSLLDLIEREGDEQEFKDTLEALTGEIEEKVENTIKLMKSLEGSIEMFGKEERRLCNRRQTILNRFESIKAYLEGELIKAKIKEVKTPLFKVTIQKNKASVIIDEDSEEYEKLKKYPEIWTEHKPTINKTKVYELLKEGKILPAVELKTTESIRIK